MSDLLIVESPAKAKTISKYLDNKYVVKASMGHLRDLPKKEMGVDIEEHFAPHYIPIEGRKKVIDELEELSKKANTVYLATDPDREGEAISWHLKELLSLPDEKTKRVTFNEITKNAVVNAMKAPRSIDMDLVNAQQARRILDRIVGYKLSPFLWRKVRKGLSAGRVQSVVTRMIVDREREIESFKPEEYWTIELLLNCRQKDFIATYYGTGKEKGKLRSGEEANAVLEAISGKELVVSNVQRSQKRKQPQPPFTTSTLQQEASRKLHMTAKVTMQRAQELYEGVEINGTPTGLITYMRTDSLRISVEALDKARGYISAEYGKDYLPSKARVFKSKKTAQDAHEAIRPADPALTPEAVRKSLSMQQYRLYKLIWSRFIASQMKEALYDTTVADILCEGYVFRTTGQSLVFDGYRAIYEESRDEEQEEFTSLPPLENGDRPELKKQEAKQHFTQPPARYTEASLIKTMEEKGIGRPSTYAPIITTVLDREYVVKEDRSLKPTALGEAVTDLMTDKFDNIIDIAFTAKMEDQLDLVENGQADYEKILEDFYGDFDEKLKKAETDLDKKRIKVPDEKSGVICEKCGREMVIKIGRFGKFLACPGYPECKNTKAITEETGAVCPVCGAKLLKKKSKKGFSYFGCEKYPECTFMTWDKPSQKNCPKCGGVLYRHVTKDERKMICYNPNCKYEEPIGRRGRKSKTDE